MLDFEAYAHQHLPRSSLDYYRSAANQQRTRDDNRQAYKRYKFRPRFLRDVNKRDLRVRVLGHDLTMPVGVSPTAMQRMAHPEGECANAKACEALGTIMILSTIATSSIEEVAAAAPSGIRWFQLYIYKDRGVTQQLVKRAEKSGFSAIVLTIDAPVFGTRHADVRNKFSLAPHLRMANFQVGDEKANRVNTSAGGSGINEYVKSLFDQSITWKDVTWLKSITKLPIVIKGVLTAEDAELSIEHGASAVFVSNHGGRQLDDVPATIDVLRELVEAVKDRAEVYIDGGITEGTDVLKALALGAKMVFVGRPALWGLCYDGQKGVEGVLQVLHDELDMAMMLSGCASISAVNKDLVHRAHSKL